MHDLSGGLFSWDQPWAVDLLPLIIDALARQESCGGHFNEDFQTKGHEAKRDDENFCHAAAWEFSGDDSQPHLHKEHLVFENVELTQRSYK